MWAVSISHTSDSLATVLAFYEQRMPGFSEVTDPGEAALYVNAREDDGPLGFLASLTGDGIHPNASAALHPDRQDASTTIIEVRIEWPAP